MTSWQQIQEAAGYVRSEIATYATTAPALPAVAMVLGSGLSVLAEQMNDPISLPYAGIPHFAPCNVGGHPGKLLVGKLAGQACALLCGRPHSYEGHPMQQVTLPVRVLAALGVRTLVLTNAAGGIKPSFEPGDLMLISDHLNLTGQNPLIGPHDERLGPRFPEMSDLYGIEERRIVLTAARTVGVSLQEGVYAGLTGPSYETPAEIRMLAGLGADAVGMSTVPEAIVARHAGLRVVGVSLITNRAAGLGNRPLSHAEVIEVAAQSTGRLAKVLTQALVGLS